jgi:hypothetical protein
MNRWKRLGETARIEEIRGRWFAWNDARVQLAVVSDWGESGGFMTQEGLEAALRADGWEPA